MFFYSFLKLIIILSLASMRSNEAQEIRSARLLDLLIRDYTFNSYDMHFKTGTIQPINLPEKFSGIKVNTVRFRCGSLKRYGAQVKEFHLRPGVTVLPCAERIMVITQNLGYNWSSIYYANYDLTGYQVISPILGLLAYNVAGDMNFSKPFEVGIQAGEKPITITFNNTRIANVSGVTPLCVSFENDGKVTFKNPVSPFVCIAKRHGHYGLVIKAPPQPPPTQVNKKISLWKVVVSCIVGTTLGVFLIGLLIVAMVVKVKRKAEMEELERKAYEEEALQVSMFGDFRAPIAASTRTMPSLENEYKYRPYPS